jgi:protein-L-isoaspartate(D-aspartate) O-methyltransferase
MPSHPVRAGDVGTLVQVLVERYPEIRGVGYRRYEGQAEREAGLVHRLDTHTSGLMLVARTQDAFEKLRAALTNRQIHKTYRLVCEGAIIETETPKVIDLPIAPHPKSKRKVIVCRDATVAARHKAQPAHTELVRAEVIQSVTDVLAQAPFARRHQIRAHMSAIGHPLLGDTRYGGLRMPGHARFFLHAQALALVHPYSRTPMQWEAPLTADLAEVLRGLVSRAGFVHTQLQQRGIQNHRVLAAMQLVPREEFVDPAHRAAAYEDAAMSIGLGQTISQPYMVARMCELANVRASDRVLDVGTGSGYQAAVLATLAREVVSVERIAELAERATGALQRARLLGEHLQVVHADGTKGMPGHGPYDAIVVAAGAPQLPVHLVQQLAPAGRLVIPIGDAEQQRLCVVRRRSGASDPQSTEFEETWHDHCRFVPLIGEQGWRPGT